MARIGPVGWGVWLAGLAYCNRNLTDGFIPWSVADGIGGRWRIYEPADSEGRERVWQVNRSSGMHGEDMDTEWIAALLVECGLWERVEGGYRVHDYAQYQPTREQAQHVSEVRAQAGAKGGQAKSKQIASNEPSKDLAISQAKFYPVPDPDPEEKDKRAGEGGTGGTSHAVAEPPAALPPPEPPAAADADASDAPTPEEQRVLDALWDIPSWPDDPDEDLRTVRQLREQYPRLDLVAEARKLAAWWRPRDQAAERHTPEGKRVRRNWTLRLQNWAQKAASPPSARGSPPRSSRADGVDGRQRLAEIQRLREREGTVMAGGG